MMLGEEKERKGGEMEKKNIGKDTREGGASRGPGDPRDQNRTAQMLVGTCILG